MVYDSAVATATPNCDTTLHFVPMQLTSIYYLAPIYSAFKFNAMNHCRRSEYAIQRTVVVAKGTNSVTASKTSVQNKCFKAKLKCNYILYYIYHLFANQVRKKVRCHGSLNCPKNRILDFLIFIINYLCNLFLTINYCILSAYEQLVWNKRYINYKKY